MRRQIYKCPSCGATKEIVDEHNRHEFPKTVFCGWRGCSSHAFPFTK